MLDAMLAVAVMWSAIYAVLLLEAEYQQVREERKG